MLLYYFASNALPAVPNGFWLTNTSFMPYCSPYFGRRNAGKYFGLDALMGKKAAAQ